MLFVFSEIELGKSKTKHAYYAIKRIVCSVLNGSDAIRRERSLGFYLIRIAEICN